MGYFLKGMAEIALAEMQGFGNRIHRQLFFVMLLQIDESISYHSRFLLIGDRRFFLIQRVVTVEIYEKGHKHREGGNVRIFIPLFGLSYDFVKQTARLGGVNLEIEFRFFAVKVIGFEKFVVSHKKIVICSVIPGNKGMNRCRIHYNEISRFGAESSAVEAEF